MTPRPGDTVIVRGGFGREPAERVTIISTGVECGRPVIDYFDRKGRERWAYFDQIEGIIEPENVK